MKTALVPGCFDLLHIAHIRMLQWVKLNYKDCELWVALNTDESVSRLKPNRPIIPYAERRQMLLALKTVDRVVPMSEDDPRRIVEIVQPDILVKGDDWRERSHQIVEYNTVEECGGEIVFAPKLSTVTTTSIIQTIQSAAVSIA
jgi:rfaE bifunctional protein nucleotidyltransferase chain/domain